MLKDFFGFAEHQEKGTYGLGNKLTFTKNSDNAVLNKGNAFNNANIKINSIDLYLPTYTPSLAQEKILMDPIVKKMHTELRYIEKFVFMKEVNTQNLCVSDLGTHQRIKFPIYNIVGFQQSDRQHDQNLNKDTFCRLSVTSAQCTIGNQNYPDSAILLKFDDDDYSQGYP